MGLFLKIIYI